VALAMRSTRSASACPMGCRSSRYWLARARRSSGSSPGRTGDLPVSPWMVLLRLERALPAGVRGPLDFWALMRLEWTCDSVDMFYLFLPFDFRVEVWGTGWVGRFGYGVEGKGRNKWRKLRMGKWEVDRPGGLSYLT